MRRYKKPRFAFSHVLGFMGDGINDAPALNAAEVGILLVCYVVLTKLMKTWFYRRFGEDGGGEGRCPSGPT